MTTTLHFSVPTISCGHCKASIEGALLPIPGVEAASVDIDTKTVEVTFGEPAVREALVAAIADVGYDVVD